MAVPKIFDMLLLTIVTYTIVATMNMPTTEATWCLPSGDATEDALQQGLDYACHNGADCVPIHPGGPFFLPDTVLNHANYAYNSYWKNHNEDPSACDFGGTAVVEISRDPSTPTCQFPASS